VVAEAEAEEVAAKVVEEVVGEVEFCPATMGMGHSVDAGGQCTLCYQTGFPPGDAQLADDELTVEFTVGEDGVISMDLITC